MDGEVFSSAHDPMIVKDRVDQSRRIVRVAVEQRLYRGRCREQRRHGRWFVVNDLRWRTHRRAVPDLMDLRRRWRGWRRRYGRRAYGTLITEQLIGRGLIAGALAAIVENILMMVTAVLVIVQRLGLARV